MDQYITDLESCYKDIPSLRSLDSKNPSFKTWEARCKRILKRIFGPESDEVRDFDKIQFWYLYGTRYHGKISKKEFDDYHFRNGIDEAEFLLKDLISEAKYLTPKMEEQAVSPEKEKKVFISHSSKDHLIGKELVDLLVLIGLKHNQIIYTSSVGQGVPLGDNWVNFLKENLNSDVVYLGLLTENFLSSQICLCEMGAAWILSKKCIPILIPPIDYNDLNGTIQHNQGIKLREKLKWTKLKSQIEIWFNLSPISGETWEEKRDEILDRIEGHICP
jgi:hypothetical protein